MQKDNSDSPRHVAPRWRSLDQTPSIELHASIRAKRNVTVSPKLHECAKKRWSIHGGLLNAAEVVDGALIFGSSTEALDAAQYIVRRNSNAMPLVRSSAQRLLDSLSKEQNVRASEIDMYEVPDIINGIRFLKERLREYPRDSVTSMEIARLHSILGQTDPARRHVERATKFSSNNRFIIRSAVRFFVHIGESDRALSVIKKSDAVRSDPWIQAAEISTCSNLDKTPEWATKQLRALLSFSKLATKYSELAAGLADLELQNGNFRMSRRLMKRSLHKPTENSLAQAIWMEMNRQMGLDFGNTFRCTPRAYEASVLYAKQQNNPQSIIENTLAWLRDEPFSQRPAVEGAFLCSTQTNDHEMALKFVDHGLRAQPKTKLNDFSPL